MQFYFWLALDSVKREERTLLERVTHVSQKADRNLAGLDKVKRISEMGKKAIEEYLGIQSEYVARCAQTASLRQVRF